LKPEDRVAVKPHASPIFHAIQYLAGNQTLEKLKNFRGFGGAQSYPSRTKDIDDVDFVVNYDIPTKHEDYQHRAGRTGRMGKKGNSVLLVNISEQTYIEKLQKKIDDVKGTLGFGEYKVGS
jgi:hypothetical protein